MSVSEGKQKWVKLQKAEMRVSGNHWYMDEDFDGFGFDVVGGLNLEEV